MYRAELSLAVLQYIGLWKPRFSSRRVFVIYNIFSFLILLLTYIFTFTTIMYLIRHNSNMEEFTENSFFALALLSGSIKIVNLFIKRDKIIELTDMLLDERFYPRDFVEVNIQTKFDNTSRIGTIIFLIMGGITIMLKATGPLTKGSNAVLPYKAWVPCNLDNRLSFWLVYALQTVGSFGVGEATIAIDTFAMVMMLQLCAQLEILMHRIQKYPQLCLEKKIYNDAFHKQNDIGMWVQHHQTMYVFGDKLNNIYWFVFLFQVLATTVDVCTSSYLLSTLSASSGQYWTMLFSLMSILFQISLYCWHGNMVIEKSKDIGNAVYKADWTLLPNDLRINLIQIMRRSTKPIIFNAGWFAPMSIESFVTILRLSYSVYSLLI